MTKGKFSQNTRIITTVYFPYLKSGQENVDYTRIAKIFDFGGGGVVERLFLKY